MSFILPLILGFLSAALALLFGVTLASLFYLPPSPEATLFLTNWPQLLIFALVEEASKALFIWRGRNLGGHFLAFWQFGLLFGIGFASLEYLLAFSAENPLAWTALGILLVHLVTSVSLSYLFWIVPTVRKFLVGFLAVVFLHFLYNALWLLD